RRRQRRLAMVNVTNRPNVAMRLAALEFLLRHRLLLLSRIRKPAKSKSVLLLTLLFLDHFLGKRRGKFRIVRKMHRERSPALGAAAQIRSVAEHLRQGDFHANDIAARAIFRALNRRTPRV